MPSLVWAPTATGNIIMYIEHDMQKIYKERIIIDYEEGRK